MSFSKFLFVVVSTLTFSGLCSAESQIEMTDLENVASEMTVTTQTVADDSNGNHKIKFTLPAAVASLQVSMSGQWIAFTPTGQDDLGHNYSADQTFAMFAGRETEAALGLEGTDQVIKVKLTFNENDDEGFDAEVTDIEQVAKSSLIQVKPQPAVQYAQAPQTTYAQAPQTAYAGTTRYGQQQTVYGARASYSSGNPYIDEINRVRASQNPPLPPITNNSSLARISQTNSRGVSYNRRGQMVNGHNHMGGKAVNGHRYQATASPGTPQQVVQQWLDSKKGHREIILNPNLRTGGIGTGNAVTFTGQ